MFPEERTNTRSDERKGQLSMMLDKTVRWLCAFLEDHCCLTIIDIQGEMAAHFSHEARVAMMHYSSRCESLCFLGFSTTHRRTSRNL